MIRFRDVPHVNRALWLAPPVPVLVYTLLVFTSIGEPWREFPRQLLLMSIYGLPVSYGVMLVVTTPVILFLQKFDSLTPTNVLIAGPVCGALLVLPLIANAGASWRGVLLTASAGLVTAIAFVLIAWTPQHVRSTEPAKS